MKRVVGLLFFIGVVCCSVESVLGQGAPKGRVLVRFDVETAEEESYEGMLILINQRGDTVYIKTNQYGLGFGYLEKDCDYSLSVGEFWHYIRFKTSANMGDEQSFELRLPPSKMKGKIAAHGKGLFLIRYKNAQGKPLSGEEVWAVNEATKRRTGAITDRMGVARIEVPAGASYTLHTVGVGQFERHSFPPVQGGKVVTVEIDVTKRAGGGVQHNKRGANKEQTVPMQKQRSGTGAVSAAAATPRRVTTPQDRPTPRLTGGHMSAQDRREAATVRLKRNRNRISRAAYAIPSRPVKPSAEVSKKIVEGVYYLREEFLETERIDPFFRNKMQLELLRPLLRNELNNVVFVLDVTCSMDAFIEEYLLWFVLARHAEGVIGSVFFNDGDGCADELKRSGHTGGIRCCASHLEALADTVVRSISFGCSGDAAENDLEALWVAQQTYPEAQALVLVADNASEVRDMELLDRINRPVHVFLCGQTTPQGELPPHPDYLTIAYRTGGSVHTLEEDLSMRQSDAVPSTLRVRGYEYRYLKGRFIRVGE